jgi:hypothetical protein
MTVQKLMLYNAAPLDDAPILAQGDEFEAKLFTTSNRERLTYEKTGCDGCGSSGDERKR